MSIAIAPPMIATAGLLLFNAGQLSGHPFLIALDITVALYLLWHSIDRHDDDLPPPQHPLVGA